MNISNSFKYLHTLIKSHKNNISQTDLYTKINLPFLKVFWALKNSDIFCLRGHFYLKNWVSYGASRPVKTWSDIGLLDQLKFRQLLSC